MDSEYNTRDPVGCEQEDDWWGWQHYQAFCYLFVCLYVSPCTNPTVGMDK